jgi:hypothetical protein
MNALLVTGTYSRLSVQLTADRIHLNGFDEHWPYHLSYFCCRKFN